MDWFYLKATIFAGNIKSLAFGGRQAIAKPSKLAQLLVLHHILLRLFNQKSEHDEVIT